MRASPSPFPPPPLVTRRLLDPRPPTPLPVPTRSHLRCAGPQPGHRGPEPGQQQEHWQQAHGAQHSFQPASLGSGPRRRQGHAGPEAHGACGLAVGA